jgi:selenide, water dikinase
VLSAIPPYVDDRVLVDFRTSDDAGVFRWEGGPALVQTVDFFTPIVDDPYVYGQIAAANALSDVYAMGGRPLTALAIAGFPQDALDSETIQAIFLGGFDKLREAGVALLGGHTIQDQEIKFGYAVTGAIDPARVWSNAGAKPGDVLFLTKPLGTGIVGTAIKFERADPAIVEQAVRSMCALNRAAAEALSTLPSGAVHACTDVTGFGLLGHASEMAAASDVTLLIETSRVPVLAGVEEMVLQNRSGGMVSNQEHFETGLGFDSDAKSQAVPSGFVERLMLLYDPQTSGGLLVAASSGAADAAEAALRAAGVDPHRIGRVIDRVGRTNVLVRP